MTLSRWPVKTTVIVNLITGTAFKGVLWKKTGPLLILKDVYGLTAGQEPQPLSGELMVERDRVEYIQTLTQVV